LLKYCLALLLLPYFSLSAKTDSCLVISEVMFFPQGSNNEFVELYNLSETENISLDSLKIKYSTSGPDIIIPQFTNTLLPPKSYAVIFEGDYDLASGIYTSLIPSNALVLQIDNNAFGSNGMANTSSRPVYLLSKNNDTLDVYTYSADNSAGYSDEKLLLNKDTSKANWKNSIVINGTPGYKNSVAPFNYNLMLDKLVFSPSLIFEGGNVSISVTVKNMGVKQSGSFIVRIYNDENADSLEAGNELLFEKAFEYLPPNDSLIVQTTINSLSARKYNIIASIIYPDDEYPADNRRLHSFQVYPKGSGYNDIVINEIMYAPETGEPEWVELYNRTDKPINLKKWEIGDKGTHVQISTRDIFINPLSMVVIAKDSSILNHYAIPVEVIKASLPSLNNDGDAVVLRDSLNVTIDSLAYLPAWGGSGGYSLERIDADVSSLQQSNWGTSVNKNKASPGIKNSIAAKNIDIKIVNFSPEKTTCEINTSNKLSVTIKNTGKQTSGVYTLKIYMDANCDSLAQSRELIKEIPQNTLAAGSSVTLFTDLTLKDSGLIYFIAVAECANDEDSTNNTAYTKINSFKIEVLRNDLLINEIMYAPKLPHPEWIEIYNNSGKQVNLKGFRIADETDTVTVFNNTIILNAGEYFVISSDSSITTYYPGNYKFEKASIPQLNNTGDKVVLLDSLNRVIDSLQYNADWCTSTSGASLERIEKSIPTINKANWGCSVDKLMGTPGRKNSIAAKEKDAAIIHLYPAINSTNISQANELTAVIKNGGKAALQDIKILFYEDKNYDSIPSQNELIKEELYLNLLQNDSVKIKAVVTSDRTGIINYIAKIFIEDDEDTLNNFKITKINWYKNTEQRNDLIITEVMYAPVNGEPEWVELYNRSGKTINLQNYKIAEEVDTIEITAEELQLLNGCYLVISTDSIIFKYYTIPCRTIIKKLPKLNNNGDKLMLLDKYSFIIDSLHYLADWGGADGKSLERIYYDSSSNKKANWKTSKNIKGGTPGVKNSVVPPDIDLFIKEVKITPELPLAGESISVSVKIINKGIKPSSFNLLIYSDTLKKNILDAQSNIPINGNDSVLVTLNSIIKNIHSDKLLFFNCACAEDEDAANNDYSRAIRVCYPASTIRINEIMYNPEGSEPEWIEFVNTSADTININSYLLSDVLATPSIYKIEKDNLLLPYSFLVIARDSLIYNYHKSIPSSIIITNIPVLNNDEDGVVITDFRGVAQDSVFYKTGFGGKAGHSIERRSLEVMSNVASNWGAATDIEKSTPGRKNSLAEKLNDLKAVDLLIVPQNPVAGEGVKIKAIIKNTGKISIGNFVTEFYYCNDTVNTNLKLIDKVISDSQLKPGDTCFVISNLEIKVEERFLAAVRIIYAADEDTTDNISIKVFNSGHIPNSVIVNEIMYDPKANMPEWIEIKNISDKSINLAGWSISDYISTPVKGKITGSDLHILPGNYLVIARDSSFFTFFPALKNQTVIASFGLLNNSDDGVILYDNTGAVISSVYYKSTWGGSTGFSLERLSEAEGKNDSTNWKSSIDVSGGTPGAVNSIINIPKYYRNSLVINEIMSDPGTDNCEYIELINTAVDTLNIGGWLFEGNGKSVYKLSDTKYILLRDEYFVVAADSVIIKKYPHLSQNKNLKILNTSSLGLTNSGGVVILKELFGGIIDSVNYPASKEGKNKSLEKLSPSSDPNTAGNWNSCSDPLGGTPGKKNSVLATNNYSASSIEITPNPFSPDNDGFEDAAQINYKLRQQVNSIRVRIFDSRGRLLRTLVNNRLTGNSGSITFNGLDDSGNTLRIGIYIVLFEAMNNINVLETLKSVVVVARKL